MGKTDSHTLTVGVSKWHFSEQFGGGVRTKVEYITFQKWTRMCTKRHALKRNWKEAPDGILEVGNVLFFDLGSAYMIFFF